MNCTIPVLTIDQQDCLGDSLGKHNYNALVLDTSICNLSSLIYNQSNNVSTVFNTLSFLLDSYKYLFSVYNDDKLYKILIASTTVNLLSSFWGNYTFSVQYPINSISLSNENLSIFAPILSSVNVQNLEITIESTLKNLASVYLHENYPPNNFSDNTIVNVVFFLYNLIPTVNDSSNETNDSLTTVSYLSGINSFNYNTRIVYPTFTRDNVHFTSGIILKYYIKNNIWNYNGYIIDDVISKAENIQQPIISSITTTNTLSPSQNNNNNCNPLFNDRYYPVSNYESFRCLVTGTSKEPATAILNFLGTDKKLISNSWTARGYNAAADAGGTDVWLEFNSITNVINVYEQNPTPKTLVNTFSTSLKSQNGVNFKFTSRNAVNLSCCGVPKIGATHLIVA
jgi:hypothetical protein